MTGVRAPRRWRRRPGSCLDETGAGSVTTLAVAAAILGFTLVVCGLLAALPGRQAAQGWADAAALAAADVASGRLPGEPCSEARRVVEQSGGELEHCQVEGGLASVRVRVESGPFVFSERARAGPPPGETPESGTAPTG